MLFGEDKNAALEYIIAWRVRARIAAREAFEIIKKTEREVYASKSFWNNKAAGYPFERG
jgi:hypothetical protein